MADKEDNWADEVEESDVTEDYEFDAPLDDDSFDIDEADPFGVSTDEEEAVEDVSEVVEEPEDFDEDGETVAETVDKKTAFSRSRSGRFRSSVVKRSKRSKISKKGAKRMQPVMKGALKNRTFISICSECYEEFTIDPNYEADKFNCPECDHPSKGPDEEFLRNFYGVKKNESFYLLMSVISFSVIVLILLIWQLLLVDPSSADSSVLNYGFLVLILASFVSGIYFGIRYEIRRYETYF